MNNDINDKNQQNRYLPVKSEFALINTEASNGNPEESVPDYPGATQTPGDKKRPELNPRFDFRSLVEIILFTAIAVVLSVLWVFSPGLGLLAPVVFPLVIFTLILRRGLVSGVIALFAETAIFAMAVDTFAAIYILLQSGLVSIFFGYAFIKEKRAGFILMYSLLIAGGGVILTLLISPYVNGLTWSSLVTQTEELMAGFFDQMAKATNIAASLPQGMTLAEYKAAIVGTMVRVLPGTMIIVALFQVFLSYLFAVMAGNKYGIRVEKLPLFDEWRLHWLLVWGVILGLALKVLGSHYSLALVSHIAANIIYVYYPLLLICGLSLFIWFLKRWKAGIFVKVIFVVLFSYNLIFSFYTLIILAAFDPLVDFRSKLKLILRTEK